jgi:arylformamidase
MTTIRRAFGCALLLCAGAQAAAFQPDGWSSQMGGQLNWKHPPPVTGYSTPFGEGVPGSIWMQPARRKGRPLVLWIGGYAVSQRSRLSTEWMPSRFFDEGYAYASISHGQPTGADFAQIRASVIEGLRAAVKLGEKEGADTSRLILVGEEDGAQLAALIATDPSWLREAGIGFGTVKATLLFEGRLFDVASALKRQSAVNAESLKRTLGGDPAVYAGRSPAAQLMPPNAPLFILAIPRDGEAAADSVEFAYALKGAGVTAETVTMPNSRGEGLITLPGAPRHRETKQVMALLARATGG